MKNSNAIFKKGSKTFYTASLFFPKDIRDKVTCLYAFVRTADDLVDQIPQKRKEFLKFKKQTEQAFLSKNINNKIIQNFVELCIQYKIEKKWVDAFLIAMEKDLTKHTYYKYKELEDYMYGSAEVIGLMMSRILMLPKKAEKTAQLQGKAMQLINFIRDVNEDIDLGRQYIPQEDLEHFGIKKLSKEVDVEKFRALIHFEIKRYKKIQQKASDGYKYIPRSSRIPIITAAKLYKWTATQIKKDPTTVFKQKIKPSKLKIITEYLKNFIHP